MAESVDCSEFCRLCLVKEQVNTPIFEEIGELQQLHVKITACLPIKVTYEDSLPKRICDDCIYKLDQQYQFWNTSVNAEKQLKQWLGICDEPPPKQETEKKVKKEKEQEAATTKRPRRNARRKAAQNVRQAAAAAIAASDSDVGLPGDDMDIEPPYTKEENDSDNDDLHDNTESLEDSSYMNVGLDSEEQAEAGPSGLQKGGTVASTNSGSDNGGAGYLQIKLEEVEVNLPNDNIIPKSENSDLLDSKTTSRKTGKITVKCESTLRGQKRQRDFKSRKVKKEGLDASNPKPYVCEVCTHGFKYKCQLDSHMYVHNKVRSFECDCCLKKFPSKKLMSTHRKRHFQAFVVHCELCSRGFYTRQELKGHMNSQHGAKEHQCEICKNTFRTIYSLKMHLITHNKITNTPYEEHKCHICGKVFHHKIYLNRHLKLHAGETKVICDICGKALNSRKSLFEHLNLHNGIKPYTCNVCNKSFGKGNTLRVHKRTHTSEKPYKCDEPNCGKSFAQSSNLAIHKRYHTGERPYRCTFCSGAFVSGFILNDHMKKHHNIIRPTNNSEINPSNKVQEIDDKKFVMALLSNT